jgi:hypothetical protein
VKASAEVGAQKFKVKNDHEMTTTSTRTWDPAEHFQSDEDMVAYLEAALKEGDASLFAAALKDIARAQGQVVTRTFTQRVCSSGQLNI